jgi:hypothetical protein
MVTPSDTGNAGPASDKLPDVFATTHWSVVLTAAHDDREKVLVRPGFPDGMGSTARSTGLFNLFPLQDFSLEFPPQFFADN